MTAHGIVMLGRSQNIQRRLEPEVQSNRWSVALYSLANASDRLSGYRTQYEWGVS